MTRPQRNPSYLIFKGWSVDGAEIRVQTRMCSKTSRATWVEHGPIMTLLIPADRLLDEDVCNAAAWAQHKREVAEHVAQLALELQAQEPLF